MYDLSRSTALLVPIMVAAGLIAVQPSWADAVPPTASVPPAAPLGQNGFPILYSLPEDIPSFDVDPVTWTNTNAVDETLVLTVPTLGYVSGDATDQVTSVEGFGGAGLCQFPAPASIGTFLAPGQSCIEDLRLFLP